MKLSNGLPAPEQPQRNRQDVYQDLVIPTLKFSAASGGIGFLFGGTIGILRGSSPVIAGLASSMQCAGIGAAFSNSRTLILQALPKQDVTPGTYTVASTLAGAISGGAAGYLLRGPRNVLPGMLCFGVLGAGGQVVANWATKPKDTSPNKPGILHRAATSGWSPVKSMSDQEYADMLKEKLLRVEVEIAILDDKIAALKTEEHVVPSLKTSRED